VSETILVSATRQDGWWSVRADVPQAVVWTQTKRLDQVEDMSREAIALALDVPKSTIDVEVEFDIPEDLLDLVEAAQTMSAVATRSQVLSTRMNHAVAGALRNRGFSVRDIGMIMGVSAQRVSQLLAGGSQVRGTVKAKQASRKVTEDSPVDLMGEFTEAVTTAVRALTKLTRRLARS
jgi:predicted transcriptional regulator